MNFSTNQVLQFFCLADDYAYAATDIVKSADGKRFKVVIPASEVISDIVDVCRIKSVTVTEAADMSECRKALKVVLASTPIAGEEYIINLKFGDPISQEVVFDKVIAAKAASTTAKDLYKALVDSALEKARIADAPKFFDIYALSSAGAITGSAITTSPAADDVQYGFAVVEAEPDWSLGRFPINLMDCAASIAPIYDGADKVGEWLDGDVVFTTALTDTAALGDTFKVLNSKKVADLEYFAMGEKGTRDPKMGWPMTPDVELKVVPSAAYGYSVLNVHFAHVGAFDSVQKSEKELIIVMKETSAGAAADALQDLADAIVALTPEGRIEALEEA